MFGFTQDGKWRSVRREVAGFSNAERVDRVEDDYEGMNADAAPNHPKLLDRSECTTLQRDEGKVWWHCELSFKASGRVGFAEVVQLFHSNFYVSIMSQNALTFACPTPLHHESSEPQT